MIKMEYTFAPLIVETDYEYDLDMSKFPGLEDPTARLQPSLLIHDQTTCYCNKTEDLQTLIDTCIDLECSESDSIVDDILGDSFSDISASTDTDHEDLFDYSSPSNNRLEELSGFVPLSETFTPDITASLLNTEEPTAEQATLTDTNKVKGVKRRLFLGVNDVNTSSSKRQNLFTYDDERMFSILDDLFNHI